MRNLGNGCNGDEANGSNGLHDYSMFDIRPQHTRLHAQFSEEWYEKCSEAALECLDFMRMAELLFLPGQRQKIQKFCEKHNIDRSVVIREFAQLGFDRTFDSAMVHARMFELLFPAAETRAKVEAYWKELSTLNRYRLFASATRTGLKQKGIL